MPSSAWNERNIAIGSSTVTESGREAVDEFVNRLQQKKFKFHALEKSGSRVEVAGFNERLIVNEVTTESAAIWAGLFDGTLINLLQDSALKEKITSVLRTYFPYTNFPAIPILLDKNSQLKYRVDESVARIYSVHGGANLRSFLASDFASDDIEMYLNTTDLLPLYYLADLLVRHMPDLAKDLPQAKSHSPWETLTYIEKYLALIQQTKQKLQRNELHLYPGEKRVLIFFELMAAIHMLLAILNALGIEHGHPHGGNWVVSWSHQNFTQEELIQQCIDPTDMSIEYEELVATYPASQLYVHLIDWDRATRVPTDESSQPLYDQEKVHQLATSQTGELHSVLAQMLVVKKVE